MIEGIYGRIRYLRRNTKEVVEEYEKEYQ